MNTQPSDPIERAREQGRDAVSEARERWQHAQAQVVQSSYSVTASRPGAMEEMKALQRAEAMARAEFDRLFARRMAESLTGGVE